MKLSSIREIKNYFLQPTAAFNVGVARPEVKFPKSIALGVAKGKLAVRVFEGNKNWSTKIQQAFVEAILAKTRNEADVQFVQLPSAIEPMIKDDAEARDNRSRTRPLRQGLSLGHFNITAGSLGCFCARDGVKGNIILTNAHVGSDCNKGKKGDNILSPGKYDQGNNPSDAVATLFDNVKLKKGSNKVDAAICLVNDDIEVDPWTIKNHGKFNGFGDGEVEIGQEVQKFGRTTSWTRGKITAVEMDGVRVQYGADLGILSFNSQIEIVGVDDNSYIMGGDSGSVTMDTNNRGVGLNFAGNNVQAYANDMQEVIKALKLKSIK